MDLETQERKILGMLQRGERVTPADALRVCNCFRLSGRIYDLKKKGHSIVKDFYKTPGGAVVASYSLAGQKEFAL